MADLYVHFGKPAALVRVSGEDSENYLQSQFSNDLRKINDKGVVYGLWLDRKGKVQADSFIIKIGQNNFLIMSYACESTLLTSLIEANIIADDVETEDLSNTARLISFWGSYAENIFSNFNLGDKHSIHEFQNGYLFNGRHSLNLNGDWLSFELQNNGFQKELESLCSKKIAVEVTQLEMEYERIRCAIPTIPKDIGPGELPQEGELETSAISFSKGCYLGQEVMARLQAMGHTQRKLYRVELAKQYDTLPQNIFVDGKKMGELRSTCDYQEKIIGLALIKRKAYEQQLPLECEAGGSLAFI